MKSIDALNKVADFHIVFNAPVEKLPIIPEPARCNLRISLITEELKELETAILEKNLTEIADALCDLQYVLSGTVLEFGLGEKFDDLFNEVHRSNMSKACKTIDEANETVEFYKKMNDIDCFIKEVGALFLVYRSSDHKVMKSINYSVAELANILT